MTEIMMLFLDWMGKAAASDAGKIIGGGAFALMIAWFNTRLGIWRDERGEQRKREGLETYTIALIVAGLREYLSGCMRVMDDTGHDARTDGELDRVVAVP